MNWEAATAIAEWLGLIAVVVSLGYVALQIRQNTTTVKASTELETGRMWSEFHARVAHSDDMADIWDKALTNPDELAPAEKRRFIWFVAEYFYLVENLFRQRELGFLSTESWLQHEKVVAGLLVHPLLDSWWKSGVSLYSEEFRGRIDHAKKALGETVWTYSPLSEL